MSLIIIEATIDPAYKKATEIFNEMYEKVTGKKLSVKTADDGESDLIVLGSDSVNDFLMTEVFEGRIKSLGIRYGTDSYAMKSYEKDGRKILVLAGGRLRSTLYAIYGYFEKFLGCGYFWDGDVIPHSEEIPLAGICVNEEPRFFYRGLRYFAHRGLKRFQAEHWGYSDWKKELLWMTKKRLNFFMMRIGMDDVWQRAFPDDVPYPDGYRKIAGPDAKDYDDRTDFWTLKYRGELREKVLEYARSLGIMYPADCGTMTHWYSRTPIEFLESKKPSFVMQEVAHYTESDTGKVFDFMKKENMDYYMHLTETMVAEHEKSSALFHTIGLGERQMFKEKEKNFALKMIAYRRIAENIKRRWPESKLMLASWDFIGWWEHKEVRNLISELDPENTIILDYTSEVDDPETGFLNWGVIGKFPWIFGLFHAYESESEIRGPYDRSDERLKVAADDSFCKGMILWPELSHSDPIILEYLSANSWAPLKLKAEALAERYCEKRYGELSGRMNFSWQKLFPFIKLSDWGGYTKRSKDDENYVKYCPSWFVHQSMWVKLTIFLRQKPQPDSALVKYWNGKIEETRPMMKDIKEAHINLSENEDGFSNEFILRDTIDLTRTVISRFLNYTIIKAVEATGNKKRVEELRAHYLSLMEILGELIAHNKDFSVYETLEGLSKEAPVNPDFETTLKRNIWNTYCSQAVYELVKYIFIEEGKIGFSHLAKPLGTEPVFNEPMKELKEKFFNTPLSKMQPVKLSPLSEVILKAAKAIEKTEKIL